MPLWETVCMLPMPRCPDESNPRSPFEERSDRRIVFLPMCSGVAADDKGWRLVPTRCHVPSDRLPRCLGGCLRTGPSMYMQCVGPSVVHLGCVPPCPAIADHLRRKKGGRKAETLRALQFEEVISEDLCNRM